MNTSKIHDYKQSTINNSTTIDSARKKQDTHLNAAAKLRKQRSDPKIQSEQFSEIGGNSMVTFKLLATIKQSVINKKGM